MSFDSLFNTFAMLLVVIDPIALAPIFVGLTQGGSVAYKRKMAYKATAIATVVLLVFVVIGDVILRILGIGLPAFRVAGGVLLFLLAIDMVFARQSGLRSTTPAERVEAEHKEDISVFPLAIPLIAGPGALTTVLLMVSQGEGDPASMAMVIGMLLLVLALTFVTLLASSRIMRVIGETGANVVGRLLGVLLAALAVQLIFDGVVTGIGVGAT